MKISKFAWVYIVFAIVTLIIFACLWRGLDNLFEAILLIVYPLVYFVGGYFAHYLKTKSSIQK